MAQAQAQALAAQAQQAQQLQAQAPEEARQPAQRRRGSLDRSTAPDGSE